MTDVILHQPPTPLQEMLGALDRSRIQRDLVRLCAADHAGRRIGTDGHDRAAAWLRATMKGLGLAVEPFHFTLDLPMLNLSAAPTLCVRPTPCVLFSDRPSLFTVDAF